MREISAIPDHFPSRNPPDHFPSRGPNLRQHGHPKPTYCPDLRVLRFLFEYANAFVGSLDKSKQVSASVFVQKTFRRHFYGRAFRHFRGSVLKIQSWARYMLCESCGTLGWFFGAVLHQIWISVRGFSSIKRTGQNEGKSEARRCRKYLALFQILVLPSSPNREAICPMICTFSSATGKKSRQWHYQI